MAAATDKDEKDIASVVPSADKDVKAEPITDVPKDEGKEDEDAWGAYWVRWPLFLVMELD